MSDIEAFIAGMPKAELHLHLEGTIGRDHRLALARRNGVTLADAGESGSRATGNYADLEDFLRVYYDGIRVLVTERDFHEATRALFERCRDNRIVHVEISFDPQPHLARGVPVEAVMGGILAARSEGYAELGISSTLIMCINRDRPLGEAFPLFDLVRPWREHITGVGLDSAERGNPPIKFTEVYDRARAEGYRLTAHCDVDQENSVRHIRQCIEVLGVERIDHGVNAIEDPALVETIRDREICLTVCPTWRPGDPGPRRTRRLRRLFDLGVRVTVNTDDPALFDSGYLTRTLTAVQAASGYSKSEMVALMRNAFRGAWVGEDGRARMLDRLSAYAARAGSAENGSG